MRLALLNKLHDIGQNQIQYATPPFYQFAVSFPSLPPRFSCREKQISSSGNFAKQKESILLRWYWRINCSYSGQKQISSFILGVYGFSTFFWANFYSFHSSTGIFFVFVLHIVSLAYLRRKTEVFVLPTVSLAHLRRKTDVFVLHTVSLSHLRRKTEVFLLRWDKLPVFCTKTWVFLLR